MRPMLTPCGHFGCFRCLFVALASSQGCPACGVRLAGPNFCRSGLMNRMLKERVAKMSIRDQSAYFRRFFRDAAWNQRRKVINPTKGCPVDISDASGEWRPGYVIDIYYRAGKTYLLLTPKEFCENPPVLALTSLRLAKRGMATMVNAESAMHANSPYSTFLYQQSSSECPPGSSEANNENVQPRGPIHAFN